jgi:hypothetical protein
MAATASETGVISHWHTLIENFQVSPLEFYSQVEAALRLRQIPDASTSRVDWKEGGLLSARREYLRVARGMLVFDICGAPFGTGFFFSWWLAKMPPPHTFLYAVLLFLAGFSAFMMFLGLLGFFKGLLFAMVVLPLLLWFAGDAVRRGARISDDTVLAMPIFGWLYERLFSPNTYYKMDTALLFQESVRHAVQEVIDQMISEKGIRALTDVEKKPIMREFFRR